MIIFLKFSNLASCSKIISIILSIIVQVAIFIRHSAIKIRLKRNGWHRMIYIFLSLDPLEYYMHLFTKVYIINKDKLHIFRMIFYRQVSTLPVNPDVIPFFKPTSLYSRRNRKNQQSSSFNFTTLNKRKDETGNTEFGSFVCLRRRPA